MTLVGLLGHFCLRLYLVSFLEANYYYHLCLFWTCYKAWFPTSNETKHYQCPHSEFCYPIESWYFIHFLNLTHVPSLINQFLHFSYILNNVQHLFWHPWFWSNHLLSQPYAYLSVSAIEYSDYCTCPSYTWYQDWPQYQLCSRPQRVYYSFRRPHQCGTASYSTVFRWPLTMSIVLAAIACVLRIQCCHSPCVYCRCWKYCCGNVVHIWELRNR